MSGLESTADGGRGADRDDRGAGSTGAAENRGRGEGAGERRMGGIGAGGIGVGSEGVGSEGAGSIGAGKKCTSERRGGGEGAGARAIVIGTVPYLNVQPLIWGLETGRVESEVFRGHAFEIVAARPRELAGRLRAGGFDAGIVPVFEYFLTPGYRIVRTGALATQREVGSVTVFSDTPLEDVRRIHLDPSSLTSVNLLRVLVAERGLRAELVDDGMPAAPGAPLPAGEARLLIGDPAIAAAGRHRFAYDLGRMWHELTGLPFVFAAWLAHPRAAGLPLGAVLGRSREIGSANLDRIAEECAGRFGTTPEFARHYFRERMSYELGERELAGWRRFWELAHKHGLAGEVREFEFHEG